MAWCMNPRCAKKNLSKNDVEFDDDINLVLCQGCYCNRHPGWKPPGHVEVLGIKPPESDGGLQYDVSLSSQNGFQFKASYNDLRFTFVASPDEIAKLLGTNRG